MKTIAITGGAGFIGQHLTALLTNKGYNVLIFTRNVANKQPKPHYSMNKTLHKKLTEKHLYAHTPILAQTEGEDMLSIARQELSLIREAAKDLLQPRAEAIAYIMRMSREM